MKATSMIGIVGTAQGSGTTHLGFMLAVYLSAVKGMKVALAEMNDSGCFRQAEIILNKKIKKIVSIYKREESDLSVLMSEGFDFVIVDFGHDYFLVREKFLICTVKIVIGNLSWWKIQNYVGFLAKTEKERSRRRWAFLSICSVKDGTKYLKKNFNINVLSVPYEPDPFCLGKDSLNFLHDLVEEYF